MRYEVGKTYTLTGDEPDYRGGTLRDSYAEDDLHFPVEAEYSGVDFEGDLMFHTADGWTIYVKNTDESADTETDFDSVQHPEHYNTNLPVGVEVIDIIEAQTAGLSGIRAVCQANILKYALRWQKKNGVEDLKKSRYYIDRLIGELE